MKKRIKIDTSLLAIIILATVFTLLFFNTSPSNRVLDEVCDFIGFVSILKGIFLRMSARGHKKFYSQKSGKLVTTGPYSVIRNPMYLGSYLIGAGFALLVWPWWSLFLFTWIFYLRFKKQVVKEEKLLTGAFGDEYKTYCEKVPRFFPTVRNWFKIKPRKVFNFKQAFSTKEKLGLITWPLLAIFLEFSQESLVKGNYNLLGTLFVFAAAAVFFAVGLGFFYYIIK